MMEGRVPGRLLSASSMYARHYTRIIPIAPIVGTVGLLVEVTLQPSLRELKSSLLVGVISYPRNISVVDQPCHVDCRYRIFVRYSDACLFHGVRPFLLLSQDFLNRDTFIIWIHLRLLRQLLHSSLAKLRSRS